MVTLCPKELDVMFVPVHEQMLTLPAVEVQSRSPVVAVIVVPVCEVRAVVVPEVTVTLPDFALTKTFVPASTSVSTLDVSRAPTVAGMMFVVEL